MSKQQENLIKIGIMVLSFGVAWGVAKATITSMETSVAGHEVRLRTVEDHIVEQRTDIKWIRHTLEKDNR